jgi:alcohol dehydrogenase
VPWAAVPTTAGTGSEVTPFANFSDKRRGYKFAVAHRRFYASLAVVDPEATVGMPPAVTAMTGMDALAHAVESYVARTSHPASEALALRAIQLIGGGLERAHDNGDDLDAREAVLLGSLLAGMAFVSTRLGVLHALAMPLGGVTDLPHGMILAALFAHGVRLNQPSRPRRFADLAAALGRPGGDAADAVDALRERLGLPAVLNSPALDGAAIEGIVDAAMRSVNVRSNPAEMTREALASILGRAAIHGGD